jgi:hypothetical protein
VLISHADTLQITQTYLCSTDNIDNVTDLNNDGDDGDDDEFDSAPREDSRLFHQYRFKNGEVGI